MHIYIIVTFNTICNGLFIITVLKRERGKEKERVSNVLLQPYCSVIAAYQYGYDLKGSFSQ